MTDADKPAFAAAFGALCLALREKEPDAVQFKVYFAAMKDLDIELVVAAAEQMAQRGTGNGAWFPKTPEWRDVAARIDVDRQALQTARIRERMKAGQPPLCLDCDDTGFALNATTNRVAPCACRKLRRLEILGRRPMPALPEAL